MDIEQVKAEINALFEECMRKREPFHRKLDLFLLPEHIAQRVLEATGLDVSGHWVCMDNFGIQHALEHHSNLISEAKRGQIAIKKEDFVKFLDVFLSPDEIQLAGQTKRTNLPLIQFVKVMEDKKFIVKEVRTVTSTKKQKVSRLVFHTMYKKEVSK